jgi:CBS domain containing-hemolysin-like protein
VTLDEIMGIFWRLLSVLVLVLINGFFVAAEFALVKIRDTQLEPFIQRGHKRARIARKVLQNLDRSLSAAQLGITLASLGLGWIGEPVFAKLIEPLATVMNIESEGARHTLSFIVGFTMITFLHIVVGEQAPKWMAIQKPLPTSLWIAAPLQLFNYIAYPFIWGLNTASLWFLRQIGIETAGEEFGHSEDELRLLVATSHKHDGVISPGREIVLNAFDLQRRVAREVMRPRREIVPFDTEAPISRCLETAEQTRFSRFPIVEGGNLDRALGFIHVKDLYAARDKARTARDLLPAAKKLVYVPETSRLERLLQIFLDRKVHMALVVDEYGGTVGLVTLENILEELVGQIQDEFDQEKPLLVKKGENTWSVDGALPLHDLAELVGETLSEDGVTTASGWMTHKLGGFPRQGDVVRVGAYEFRVEEMDGARVARLSLTRAPGTEAADRPVMSGQ